MESFSARLFAKVCTVCEATLESARETLSTAPLSEETIETLSMNNVLVGVVAQGVQ